MEYSGKSVIVCKFGGYECLKVDKYRLLPLEKNVEVEVKYCGLNFADLYTRLGLIPKKVPFVLGMECTGTVTKIGPSAITNLKVGDQVICYDYTGGMYTNILRINPIKCFLLPNDIPLKEGATLFVNYLTAYFTLFHLGNLKPKETVLIKSCAGGVGWAATQLARSIDTSTEKVTIIGITSKTKENSVKENGIDYILNYDNFEEELKKIAPYGVDLIMETEATNGENDSKILKPLGRIVLLGSNKTITNSQKISIFEMFQTWWQTKDIRPLDLIMNNRSISGLHLGLLANDQDLINEALKKIYDLYHKEIIKPKIDSVWKFDDIVDATKRLADRYNVGKVLLEVD